MSIIDFIKQIFTKPDVKQNNSGDFLLIEQNNTRPPHVSYPSDVEHSMNESINRQTDLLSPQLYQLNVGYGYSIGLRREKNQDSIFTFTSVFARDNQHIPFGLYIVADGMGGHELGEIASQSAIRAVVDHCMTTLFIPSLNEYRGEISDPIPPRSVEDILRFAVQRARTLVMEQAPQGGTTLTVALILGQKIYIAHIGDSRAYAITKTSLEVLTRDHSLVKRLEELGQLTPDEAAVHPQRNVLYRAIGQGEQGEPEILTQNVPEDGNLLLCSDGLWGVVNEEQIIQIIRETSSPQESCYRLIKAANEGGGPDNISMILVGFSRLGID